MTRLSAELLLRLTISEEYSTRIQTRGSQLHFNFGILSGLVLSLVQYGRHEILCARGGVGPLTLSVQGTPAPGMLQVASCSKESHGWIANCQAPCGHVPNSNTLDGALHIAASPDQSNAAVI